MYKDSLGNTLSVGDRYIHKNSTYATTVYELTKEGTRVWFHRDVAEGHLIIGDGMPLGNYLNWTIKYPSELPLTRESVTMFRALCGWEPVCYGDKKHNENEYES